MAIFLLSLAAILANPFREFEFLYPPANKAQNQLATLWRVYVGSRIPLEKHHFRRRRNKPRRGFFCDKRKSAANVTRVWFTPRALKGHDVYAWMGSFTSEWEKRHLKGRDRLAPGRRIIREIKNTPPLLTGKTAARFSRARRVASFFSGRANIANKFITSKQKAKNLNRRFWARPRFRNKFILRLGFHYARAKKERKTRLRPRNVVIFAAHCSTRFGKWRGLEGKLILGLFLSHFHIWFGRWWIEFSLDSLVKI